MPEGELSKIQHQKRLLSRLARVEGQIRAIRRMIESEEPCEAIAQQLAASRSAMNKAFCEMISCAIEHEIDADGALNEEAQQKLRALTQLLSKYG
jgi:DNA-binding FrmR family transcriptional regulator